MNLDALAGERGADLEPRAGSTGRIAHGGPLREVDGAAVRHRRFQTALAGAETMVAGEAVAPQEEMALAGAEADVVLERAASAIGGPLQIEAAVLLEVGVAIGGALDAATRGGAEPIEHARPAGGDVQLDDRLAAGVHVGQGRRIFEGIGQRVAVGIDGQGDRGRAGDGVGAADANHRARPPVVCPESDLVDAASQRHRRERGGVVDARRRVGHAAERDVARRDEGPLRGQGIDLAVVVDGGAEVAGEPGELEARALGRGGRGAGADVGGAQADGAGRDGLGRAAAIGIERHGGVDGGLEGAR